VSKGTKSKTKLQVFPPQAGQIVTDKLFTGYRSSGIEVARTLHRRLYETWEASLLMCVMLQQEVPQLRAAKTVRDS
jgi:hypothetical protein